VLKRKRRISCGDFNQTLHIILFSTDIEELLVERLGSNQALNPNSLSFTIDNAQALQLACRQGVVRIKVETSEKLEIPVSKQGGWKYVFSCFSHCLSLVLKATFHIFLPKKGQLQEGEIGVEVSDYDDDISIDGESGTFSDVESDTDEIVVPVIRNQPTLERVVGRLSLLIKIIARISRFFRVI
jgi:hypothetical protein